MKKIIETFVISQNKKIELYFPDIKNKFNYYYKPTNKLHKFDEAVVAYRYNNSIIQLHKDVLDDAVLSLIGQLQRAHQGLLELPSFIEQRNFTYYFNEAHKEVFLELDKTIDLDHHWVWSQPSGKPETFMYTVNGSIYLEIGFLYEWYTIDDLDFDKMLYSEFIKKYKPIAVEQISEETAKLWIKQCEKLLKQIL